MKINNNQSWQTVAIVGLGVAVAPLDTAVNIAFPAITQAFQLPVPMIQWIVICYILTYASLLLNCGRWADIAGHRQVFITGTALSTIALGLCALAPSYSWLLLFRVLQALGVAMVLASGPALVTLAFPPEKRSKALAGYGLVYSCASALGPLAGGFIIDRWGWNSVFWARMPLTLLAAVLALLFISASKSSSKSRQRFDWFGGALLMIALIFLLLSINRLGTTGLSVISVTTATIGAIALIAFIRQQLHCDAALIDLTLFRFPSFASANLAHALGQMAGFVVLLLCPYYLVLAFQGDIVRAGIVLSLSPLGMMLASLIVAALASKLSAQQICQLGAMLLSAGSFVIGLWSSTTDLLFIIAALIIHGIGLGLLQVATMDLVMATLPRDAQGVAGSLVMLTRTIGVVIGAGASFALFAALHESAVANVALDDHFIDAFRITFWSAAAVSAGAWLLLFCSNHAARSESR